LRHYGTRVLIENENKLREGVVSKPITP
jgi:hypothetical protein